jgi:methionyl-tRNA synthetase
VATLVELLEAVSVMIAPVMPTVSAKMREQLGLSALEAEVGRDAWPFELPRRAPGGALRRGEPIFPRLEKETEKALVARFAPPKAETGKGEAPAKGEPAKEPAAAPEAKATITYDDFAKLDLRLGVVVSADRIKKKDRLLDLRVDVGEAAPRRIIAGIAAAYAPEALVGKQVVVLANLAPREFAKGLVSEGMLLAASADGRLQLVTVPEAQPAGTQVK